MDSSSPLRGCLPVASFPVQFSSPSLGLRGTACGSSSIYTSCRTRSNGKQDGTLRQQRSPNRPSYHNAKCDTGDVAAQGGAGSVTATMPLRDQHPVSPYWASTLHTESRLLHFLQLAREERPVTQESFRRRSPRGNHHKESSSEPTGRSAAGIRRWRWKHLLEPQQHLQNEEEWCQVVAQAKRLSAALQQLQDFIESVEKLAEEVTTLEVRQQVLCEKYWASSPSASSSYSLHPCQYRSDNAAPSLPSPVPAASVSNNLANAFLASSVRGTGNGEEKEEDDEGNEDAAAVRRALYEELFLLHGDGPSVPSVFLVVVPLASSLKASKASTTTTTTATEEPPSPPLSHPRTVMCSPCRFALLQLHFVVSQWWSELEKETRKCYRLLQRCFLETTAAASSTTVGCGGRCAVEEATTTLSDADTTLSYVQRGLDACHATIHCHRHHLSMAVEQQSTIRQRLRAVILATSEQQQQVEVQGGSEKSQWDVSGGGAAAASAAAALPPLPPLPAHSRELRQLLSEVLNTEGDDTEEEEGREEQKSRKRKRTTQPPPTSSSSHAVVVEGDTVAAAAAAAATLSSSAPSSLHSSISMRSRPTRSRHSVRHSPPRSHGRTALTAPHDGEAASPSSHPTRKRSRWAAETGSPNNEWTLDEGDESRSSSCSRSSSSKSASESPPSSRGERGGWLRRGGRRSWWFARKRTSPPLSSSHVPTEREEESDGDTGDQPQRFGFRSGGYPLLKVLPRFVSAVVRRALDFDDDDE